MMELVPWEQELWQQRPEHQSHMCCVLANTAVPRSARPYAVLPLGGLCIGWNSPSSSPSCSPPMTSQPPLLSLCSRLAVTSLPLFLWNTSGVLQTWKRCAVNTHIPNHLDSFINVLLSALSRLSLSFHFSVHLSAYLILSMHFTVSCRHQYTSP